MDDSTSVTITGQSKEPPLIVASAGRMAAARQAQLVSYLRAGGQVLLAPVLPTHDETGQPCTILRDFLGGVTQHPAPSGPVRLTVAGLPNLPHLGPVFFAEGLPEGAVILGVDEFSGRPLAWEQSLPGGGPGPGKIIVLGWAWSHAVQRQEQMLARLLARLGLEQRVRCSNPNVWTSLRTAGERSILFLMNLFSSPMEATVRCRPSWSPTVLDAGTHHLEPLTVQWVELGEGPGG